MSDTEEAPGELRGIGPEISEMNDLVSIAGQLPIDHFQYQKLRQCMERVFIHLRNYRRAALEQRQPAEFILVPKTATPGMLQYLTDFPRPRTPAEAQRQYLAMITLAPMADIAKPTSESKQ